MRPGRLVNAPSVCLHPPAPPVCPTACMCGCCSVLGPMQHPVSTFTTEGNATARCDFCRQRHVVYNQSQRVIDKRALAETCPACPLPMASVLKAAMERQFDLKWAARCAERPRQQTLPTLGTIARPHAHHRPCCVQMKWDTYKRTKNRKLHVAKKKAAAARAATAPAAAPTTAPLPLLPPSPSQWQPPQCDGVPASTEAPTSHAQVWFNAAAVFAPTSTWLLGRSQRRAAVSSPCLSFVLLLLSRCSNIR